MRKSDLVEIWFEQASQLDLNCSENVTNCCKKLLVELKYKTKDNLNLNALNILGHAKYGFQTKY